MMTKIGTPRNQATMPFMRVLLLLFGRGTPVRGKGSVRCGGAEDVPSRVAPVSM